MAALNNITAPDGYTSASTIDTGQVLSHVVLDVYNQAIYWQLKQIVRPGQPANMADWQPEVFMAPASRTIDRDGIVGVRVRAAVPAGSLPAGATQAQVTVEAVQHG